MNTEPGSLPLVPQIQLLQAMAPVCSEEVVWVTRRVSPHLPLVSATGSVPSSAAPGSLLGPLLRTPPPQCRLAKLQPWHHPDATDLTAAVSSDPCNSCQLPRQWMAQTSMRRADVQSLPALPIALSAGRLHSPARFSEGPWQALLVPPANTLAPPHSVLCTAPALPTWTTVVAPTAASAVAGGIL